MLYSISFGPDADANPTVVDVVIRDNGAIEARIGGRTFEVEAVAVSATQLSVRCDGQVVDVTTHGRPPELGVVTRGLRSAVRVESDRTRPIDRGPSDRASKGPTVVRSPMPGRVVRVFVAAGDQVRPGQALLVLEAMKMENEVRASAAGAVLDVHVSPGAAIDANARLMTLGPIAGEVF